MWRPIWWTHAPAARDVVCVGRIVGGNRRIVRFEPCDVHAYVSGVPLVDAERAALASGATVERADVACIYAEHAPTPLLRIVAPSRAALLGALAAVRAPETFESGVTSLTRLLQRRGYAPHGLFSLEGDAEPEIAREPRDSPCGFVVAVLTSTCAVRVDDVTLQLERHELARWLEAREVDVVVSFDADVRVEACVSVTLRTVLADGKCSTLEQLARVTLPRNGETLGVEDELDVLARITSELGVVEHLVELANVTGVQLRELVRRGVVHRSLEQVLRAANAAGYVLPDVPKRTRTERPRLEGGLVLAPVVGVHRDAVSVLDFRSMYPSLIMAHNMCYTPTGAVLPPLMRSMHAWRASLQRAAQAETCPLASRRLDARQRAIKLAMNCVFGMAACADGPLPCARLAARITAAGRDALTLAAAELASAATIVYGDSVTEDTRVLVYDGDERTELTVAQLFDAYERAPHARPLLTHTLRGVAPIRAVLRRASTKPVFRVTLASGASVDVTADHSLVARDGTLVSPRDLVVGQTRLATVARC
jgi:hypothetical protein